MDDKNTSTQSSMTSTMTPNTPGYLSTGFGQLVGQLTNASENPGDYYPEASSTLQNAAFNDALSLPSIGTSSLNTAMNDALSLTGTSAPTYSATGYTPTTASYTGYAPTSANAAEISTGDINRLMSPYLNDVVNSSTALYDKQAGQDQATLAANAGLNNGAFGSSGYALDQSNLVGTQALDRSNIQSSLLNEGYDTSLTGAEQDSAQQQATNLANAAAANSASAFNANAANTAGLYNANAANTASEFGANATNTASQSNQSAQLQTLQQQLAAALGAGGLASNQNSLAAADTSLLGSLGQTQYGQDVAQEQFYPNFEAQLLQILNGTPVGALSGATTTGSSTGSGSSSGFGLTGLGITKNGISFSGG